MPYMTVPRNGKYYVHKRGADGRPEGAALGTHDTEESANRQVAAIYASEAKDRKKNAPYESIDMRPPEGAAKAAGRGLDSGEGRSHYRALAEQIKRQDVLTLRSLKVMASCRAEPDSPEHLLLGGGPGIRWAKGILDRVQRIQEDTSVKTITSGNAGSAGFGVPDDGIEEQEAVAKYKVADVVVIKSQNFRGIVTNAVPRKGGQIVYTVAAKDGSFAFSTASDMERIGTRSVKQIPQAGPVARRANWIIGGLDRIRQLLLTDTRTNRIRALRILYTIDGKLTDLSVAGPTDVRSEAGKALRALLPITNHHAQLVIDPARYPLRRWLRGINEARQQVARIEMKRGTRSANRDDLEPELDEDAVLAAYQARHAAKSVSEAPTPAQAQESPDSVPASPAAAVKALAGQIEHYQKVRQERVLDRVYDAAEVLRAHVVVSGDQAAIKALADMEETLYADQRDQLDSWASSLYDGLKAIGAYYPSNEEDDEDASDTSESMATAGAPEGDPQDSALDAPDEEPAPVAAGAEA